MQRRFLLRWYPFLMQILIFILLPAISWALPTSADQAQRVVQNWIAMDAEPLESSLSSTVSEVVTYYDESSDPVYHIVYLAPLGFVIVAGDDQVEPIIGFVPAGDEYEASLDNPVGALVTQDVPYRVLRAREIESQGVGAASSVESELSTAAKSKWLMLDRDEAISPLEYGLSSISDVRVPPFVQTRWNQTTENGGSQCYNLYTPNHYPSGCVATAFSQIMRFYQFPSSAVGTPSFTIEVDNVSQSKSLLGGNGSGGVYSWALMDLGPAVSTASHREAIGRLLHDAGVSVNMSYESGGSASDTLVIADRIKSTFSYSNAKKGYNFGNNILSVNLKNMVNPNLDAGFPVVFGITGTSGGHAIVGDGYGYNSSTLYHHLNMGWGGYEDAWYNLPNINSSIPFTSVYKAVYNIYPSGTGEIISGRVVSSSGVPMSGVTVTAVRAGGGTYTDITDAKGIYAIAKIPSASSYHLSAAKTGSTFTSQNVTTLTSTDNGAAGNKWAINFTAAGGPALSLGDAVDNTSLSWTTSGNAVWFGQNAISLFEGDAAESGNIGDGQTSSMQTTVSGAGKLSFYWKVSSEENYDYLRFYIDGVEQKGSICGSVDWTQKTYAIAGAGSHALRWSYTKDVSLSSGSDTGWVDKVIWSKGLAKSPWSLFLPAITSGSQCNVSGSWTRYFDWGCDGTNGYVVDQIKQDHTWTASSGSYGTWTLTNAKFTYMYPNGTKYQGTLNAKCTSMNGTMRDYAGYSGCWSAHRNAPGSRLQITQEPAGKNSETKNDSGMKD